MLVTIDTLRADHFDATRAGVALTPALSRLARGGRTYRDASSVGTETSPGVIGVLTGLLPARSGVVGNRKSLGSHVETISETLRAAGFRTAAFVSNANLGPRLGYEQGFETYELLQPQEGRAKARAEAVLARASGWLARHGAARERLFLWVHLLEPHGPYDPPAASRERFALEAFGPSREVALLEGSNHGFGGVPAYQQIGSEPSRDPRDYLARYAAEVHALDEVLGGWLESDPVRGLLRRSVLVVTADHGEALEGDHGYFFSHGHDFTQDQVAVPLFVRAPGLAAGEVDAPVSTMDLAPTVLELLRVEPRARFDGRSLLSSSRPSLVAGSDEVGRGFVRQRELKFVRYRVMRSTPEQEAGVFSRLYRLDLDPGELVDREELAEQRDRLANVLTRLAKRSWSDAPAAPAEPIDEELAESLRALGYL